MLHVDRSMPKASKDKAAEMESAKRSRVSRDKSFVAQEAELRPDAAPGSGLRASAQDRDATRRPDPRMGARRDSRADAVVEGARDAGALDASGPVGVPAHGDLAAAAASFTSAYGALPIERLRVDMSAKVASLGALPGVSFEDYSDVVMGDGQIQELLAGIEEILRHPGREHDADEVKQHISDMLLHACIVPVQYQGRGRDKSQRLALEPVSPVTLTRALSEIRGQLVLEESAAEAKTVKGTNVEGEEETALQRILRLSVMNVQVDEREALVSSELYQSLRASDDLLQSMLATSGADEQRFLNTCSVAAMNQEIFTKIGNIAGLLMVGRNAIDKVLAKLGQTSARRREATWNRGLSGRKTYEDRIREQVAKVSDAFDAIEAQAKALVEQPGQDVAAYHALTREWSMAMQRLGAVMAPDNKPSDLPIPTVKKIDEKWHLSLLPGAAKLFSHRRMQRLSGVDREANIDTVNSTVTLDAKDDIKSLPRGGGRNVRKVDFREMRIPRGGDEALAQMQALWTKVFSRNGVQSSTGSHALFVKAVRQGGRDMFLVSDPMTSDHRPYSLEDMAAFIRSSGLRFPSSL